MQPRQPTFCEAQSVHADDENGVQQYIVDDEPHAKKGRTSFSREGRKKHEDDLEDAFDHSCLAQRPASRNL